ncbi:MAG: T9SS type A sorting domain-containing protein [Saprospiraceae bacterium]
MRINTRLKTTALLLFTILYVPLCQGQVNFGIELSEDNKTYIVSLQSEEDIAPPFNRIGTAQITMKVPTDLNFEITNLTTAFEHVIWDQNARVNAPKESPEFDYLSFGLLSMGTDLIPFEAGEKVTIFTFESKNGCPGEISLVDNASDPFRYPNSKKVNIKNHVSVLGIGMSAYQNNFSESATCRDIEESTTIDGFEVISLQPNPAHEEVTISYNNTSTEVINFKVVDATGNILQEVAPDNNASTNTLSFDVSQFANGCYFIHITKDNEEPSFLKFIKL